MNEHVDIIFRSSLTFNKKIKSMSIKKSSKVHFFSYFHNYCFIILRT
jgi:hypothetical protein